MSIRRADADVPAEPARHDPDADLAEMLDLDTGFGLTAFGSEHTEQREATPIAQEVPASDARIPAPDVASESTLSLFTADATLDNAAPQLTGATDALETRDPPPVPWQPTPPRADSQPAGRRWDVISTAAVVILVIVAGSIWASRRPVPPASTGELSVGSTPSGARVVIDGTDRGSTPLSLALAAGTYELELRSGDERHVLPVRVNAGATTAQHVVLQKPGSGSAGTLSITSEPPAAAVAVDGQDRGSTPVLLEHVPAGRHELVVTGGSGSVRRRVQVDPDATTTVIVPLPQRARPQATGGWLSITTPVELQVFEGDRLLGTTRVNRLMLPSGPHTLRLSNQAAGIDLTRDVRIEGGQTARLNLTLPAGTLSVNAIPWASVSVDGRDVGETPLGRVEVNPGVHEVVFTHPELGQRRQSVTVRPGTVTRLSVDLRR